MANIKLLGRLFITCDIEAVTGLHIGGNGAALEIGGQDNPVIRHAVNRQPYIPGSSLRGKMRSQLEKKLGSKQNQRVGKATIHVCKDEDAENPCQVCRIFGLTAAEKNGSPTRLIVRDVAMTEASVKMLIGSHTDQLFTETKSENAIDRVTSAAAPRNIERVPSGTVFGPAELVFSIYEASDIELFGTLLDCMQLVEDDYLGGGGSRGNGQVRFKNIKISGRNNADYSHEEELGDYETLFEFESDLAELKQRIEKYVLKG